MSLRPFVHVGHDLAGRRPGEHLALEDEDLHRLRTVLRLRVGALVEVADGRGVVASGRLTADGIVLDGEPWTVARPLPTLWLAQAIPKGRRFDDVVRQATELGVDGIRPVRADRGVARVEGARRDRASERWTAVARAAAEQSRRPWRPEIADVVAPATLPRPGVLTLVADPGAPGLPAVLHAAGPAPVIEVAIGPEGGWTAEERTELLAAGARAVGIGPSILRTEHAGAAALAALAALTGRWDAAPR